MIVNSRGMSVKCSEEDYHICTDSLRLTMGYSTTELRAYFIYSNIVKLLIPAACELLYF